MKRLDISNNKLTLSELKCLFDGPCKWRELLTLDIQGTFDGNEYDEITDYMNEIVGRGFLPSLRKLGINLFGHRNKHWNNLEKLMLNQCEDDALRNIMDAVCWVYLPALRTLCIRYFDGHDADIVCTLSQLGVSCHKSYIPPDRLFYSERCICET